MTSDRRNEWMLWAAGAILMINMALVGVIYANMKDQLDKKADQKIVDMMYEDLKATRAMVESHIMATGAGTVEVDKP